MSRYAVVKDGQVVNAVEWDGETGWSPPSGTETVPVADEQVGIGWGWSERDGFIAPPPGPAPEPVVTDRARIYALAERLGVDPADVEQDAASR